MKKIILGILFAVLCCAVLTPMSVFAIDYVPKTIEIDDTYIERAVVSDEPVKVGAEVRNAERQVLWDAEVIWSVISGEEVCEVVDNKLFIRSAGEFTVRATAKDNGEVFDEVSGTAYDVTFSNIVFNSKFENITVYTQPIRLSGSVDVVGIIAPGDCHYEVAFRVVSGPAEIYCDEFLKINGVGEVEVEVYSIYDKSVSLTQTFTVTDPDAGKIAGSDIELIQGDINKPPLTPLIIALIIVGCVAVVCAAAAIVAVTMRRKRNKKEQED